MTTETKKDDQGNDLPPDDENKLSAEEQARIDALVEERVAEKLKPIKDKLDKAFEGKTAAEKRLAELEKKERDAELKALDDAGKHREAYELRLKEEREAREEETRKREAAERRTVELTRDLDLRNALAEYQFRNTNALDMAFKEIVGQLVQNATGHWVHKSGSMIQEYVKSFTENKDNAFLFKAKVNNGSGSSNNSNGSPSDDNSNKSVFDLSQDEVLKRAEAGTLRRRR